MRNIARCSTGHDRPESAVTIAGIRKTSSNLSLTNVSFR